MQTESMQTQARQGAGKGPGYVLWVGRPLSRWLSLLTHTALALQAGVKSVVNLSHFFLKKLSLFTHSQS